MSSDTPAFKVKPKPTAKVEALVTKKERSPSFPFIGLTRALDRVRVVYEAARRQEALLSSVGKAWGWKPKSSGMLQTAAALIAYGLLEDSGSGESRKVRVTELAYRALVDTRPGAKDAALAEAARKPKLIGEYLEKWADGRPSDDICIGELRADRNFTEEGAASFLRVFDDTSRYASPQSGRVVAGEASSAEEVSHENVGESDASAVWQSSKTPQDSPLSQTIQTREEKFALAEGDVILRFPARLSADSIADLEGYLAVFFRKARREAEKATTADLTR